MRKADLSLSLDVIYHLVEDDVFEYYMRTLFEASNGYVIIYASDSDDGQRYKGGTSDIESSRPGSSRICRTGNSWNICQIGIHIVGIIVGSFAEFFIYEKA